MAENKIDYGKTGIKAAFFEGPLETEVPAADVTVAAGSNDLPAGDLQTVLQDIYNILATKADA